VLAPGGARDALSAPAAAGEPTPDELTGKLTLVFVHGVGGTNEDQPFVRKLRSVAAKTDYPLTVTCYAWGSVEIRLATAGRNWLAAQRQAVAEAAKFKQAVIDKYERERVPYTLVGHSLGARVIAEALGRCDRRPRFLRGVYFLGAAMPADLKLARPALPVGMKIVNYHSPAYDCVLKTAFYFMEGERAGGEVGFDDRESFENYRVACTHLHKGVAVHCDYSQLAIPIAHLCLRGQGAGIPGKTKLNVRAPVASGGTWWNDVATYRDVPLRGRQVTIVLQQHKAKAGHFRAVSTTADGTGRRREAWGDNPNAILEGLGL
jgi:pimeloyl-ACP methyl ester carboxylesterase